MEEEGYTDIPDCLGLVGLSPPRGSFAGTQGTLHPAIVMAKIYYSDAARYTSSKRESVQFCILQAGRCHGVGRCQHPCNTFLLRKAWVLTSGPLQFDLPREAGVHCKSLFVLSRQPGTAGSTESLSPSQTLARASLSTLPSPAPHCNKPEPGSSAQGGLQWEQG